MSVNMGGYVFFKKELKAILRTYRIWLIPAIFVLFGILSPVTAKFLPAIIKAAAQSDAQQQKVLLQIKIPEPTAIDAYLQWLSNLSQFGMLALILLSMGLISEEKVRGTLDMVVVKPVSRTSIVISKFVSQAGLFAVSSVIGLGVCYLYTFLLFDKAPFRPLMLSSIPFAAYGLLILSITLLFSTLMKNQMAAAGLGLISYFAFSIIASIGHWFEKYSPGSLSTFATKIAIGGQQLPDSYYAIAVSVVSSLIVVGLAAVVLERQEL